jgi:acyl-CoA synthetase (AMP-forming)/AMP-acid ligase II
LQPGPALAHYARRYRCTHVLFPPSVLSLLNPDDFPTLEVVMAGGEACPAGVADQWLRRAGRRFFNLYGPTECSIWTTLKECFPGAGTPTIGRPIRNTQAHILDRQGRPLPVGVPGELYLGGLGVGAGYLNRPELTAERFVPDPNEPGGTLYRTGDLARYRADGEIEFLGRIDHQVKIRGFRIELGEIEAVLAAHPDVREAVVLAREEATGDRRLVAYVVTRGAADTAALRAYLKERLPGYMVPAAIEALEALPLNASGKADRKALQERPLVQQASEQLPAPVTGLERDIAQIMGRLLGLPAIGPDDAFFDSGGHSLLVPLLASEIERRCGYEVPLTTLYTADTPRLLARALTARSERPAPADAGSAEAVEVAPASRRMLFC